MSGRCLALWLVTALIAGTTSGQLSQETDLEISLGFDPCNGHACPAGEVCKAVVNHRLLQLPVARCVKSSTPGDNGGCLNLAIGSNMLNCKTEEEWRKITRIQCMLRGGIESLQLTTMQVQQACHSRNSDTTTFLQAKFTCCLTETPPTIDTETATKPSSSSTPGEGKTPPKPFGTTQETATDNREQVATTSTSGAVQDEVVIVTYHSFIIAAFVMAAVLVVGLVVICFVSRRRANRSKSSSKAPPTVYINTNCDDHSHLKHSYSNTTLLSSPDLPLVEHQY